VADDDDVGDDEGCCWGGGILSLFSERGSSTEGVFEVGGADGSGLRKASACNLLSFLFELLAAAAAVVDADDDDDDDDDDDEVDFTEDEGGVAEEDEVLMSLLVRVRVFSLTATPLSWSKSSTSSP
jgi:hypothetical protein